MSSASHESIITVSLRHGFRTAYGLRPSLVALALLCWLNVSPLRAQSYLENVGTPSFTTNLPVENGSINVANGDLHLEIPLGSYPERGDATDKVVLMYDSSIWFPYGIWEPTNISGSLGGWRLVTSGDTGATTYGEYDYSWCTPADDYRLARYSPWIWTAPDGTQHSFPVSLTEPLYPEQCPGAGTASAGAYASDGSGFFMSVTNYGASATVYAPDGTASLVGSVKTDPNGNRYTSSATFSPYDYKYLGTTGSTVVEVTESSDGNTLYYAVPNTQGGQSTYTVKLETVYVDTNFGQKNVAEYSGSFKAVSEVDLPDGTAYYFTYDSFANTPGYYGLLTSMTLPAGSEIIYAYNNFTDAAGNVSRWISSRLTPDSIYGWSYTPQVSSTCASGYVDCQQLVTVVKPSGNYAKYTFTLNGGAWPTLAQYYSSSSSLLASTSVCYNFVTVSNGSCSYSVTAGASATNVYRTATTTTLGSVSQTAEYSWDPANIGNLTQESEWKFGNSPTNPADRTTAISYWSSGQIINRPETVTVSGATGWGTNGQASQTIYDYDGHGNLTSISHWLNSGSPTLTQYTYTVYGMPATMTDPNNNQTTYTYDSTGAYLSQIQFPTPSDSIAQIEKFSFDSNTGLMTSHTDRNGNLTTYSYDNMLRPLAINYPDGGLTFFNRQSATQIQIVEKMDPQNDDRDVYVQADSLGRQDRAAVTNGETSPYDETSDICFNGDGLVGFQAYAFQDGGWYNAKSCSLAGDTFAYDGLGRVTSVTHSDGSVVATSYAGNCATVTDEQLKTRESCTDGLDGPTQIIEDPSGLNFATNYTYDTLGDLTSVNDNGQSRSFSYDSLSRLTSAANPESGKTNYSYDANGNVTNRTDARNITTTYTYDALNRLGSKTYSDGTPTAYYFYDETSNSGVTEKNTVGRLTTEGSYANNLWLAATKFSYDPMGRVILNAQETQSSWFGWQPSYIYNLLGGITSYTNGAGVTFTQSFNAGGRVTQITSSYSDSQHPATLVSGVHYNGAGEMTAATLGNGLTETAAYNPLLQPCRANVNSTGTVLGTCGDAVPSGNVLDLNAGFNYGSGDNGNVMAWSAAGGSVFNRTYSYDALNRLSTMSAPGDQCSGLSWSYDAWGNRTAQAPAGGTCYSWSAGYNGLNQPTNPGYTFDAAGNMTHDASHTYTYDAENRITQVDGGSTASYVYDAEGRRVQRIVGGVTTNYVYDLAGNVMAEFGCASCWNVGYIYSNGALKAIYTNNTTYFVHADHLGSTRLLTGYPTPSIVECNDYYPFGELTSCGGSSITTHEFTGKERDSESNLDNFGARYFSSQMGRMMGPDPGNAGADPSNPQSWNMYSYVMNNPLTLTDPTGMDAGCDPSEGCININIGVCLAFCGGPSEDRQPPIYSPPPPTTDPNPSAGDPDPDGPFSGPIWQEINLPLQPLNLASLFGIQMPSPFIIDNWTTDQNGNVIGENPGEQLCGVFGGICVYWNFGEWDSSTPDEASVLGEALNNTGIQSLANPCTAGAFYALSAIGGVFTSGEALSQAGEAATTYWPQALTWTTSWLYQQSSRGFSFLINLGKNYNRAKDGVVGACNAME